MTTKHIAKPAGGRNADLVGHITAIRELGTRTIANVIEIGKRLTECKGIVGARNFNNWIDREFAWGERHARNFMYLYELAEAKSENFSELELSVSSLFLLAAPSTPEPVCDEIIKRAKGGEKLKHAEVKRKIATARKQPAPKPAKVASSAAKVIAKRAGAAAPQRETVAQAQKDVGPESSSELQRKLARLGELENVNRVQATKIIGLASEIEDLRARPSTATLSSDVYLNATCEERQRFLAAIGIDRLLDDLPAELHRRLVAQYQGAKPETPLNPTEAALAQLAAEKTPAPTDNGLDDIPPFLQRTKKKVH